MTGKAEKKTDEGNRWLRCLGRLAFTAPMVQVFRLSEAYRARTRDKGAALERAELEVCAALAVAFDLAAVGQEPC